MEKLHKLFFLTRFIKVLVPLLLVVGAAYLAAIYQAELSRIDKLKASISSTAVLKKTLIQEDMARLTKQARTLAQLPGLIFFATHPTPQNRQHTADYFKSFLFEDRNVDQVRFVDAQGYEKIRVNFNNGFPEILPSEALQDKSDRYYVEKGLRLHAREVYISPLDLNIENGQLERPLKPMIRFVTPVIHQDKLLGLVIINYLAAELQNAMISTLDGVDKRNQFLLTNTAGDVYFNNRHPLGQTLLALFDNTPEKITLPSALIEQMQTDAIGEFTADNGTYLYNRFDFLQTRETLAKLDDKLANFKSVQFIPFEVLNEQSFIFSTSGILQLLIVIILCIITAAYIAHAALRREIDALKLIQAEEERRNELMTTLQSVPTGLLIVDGDDRITMVNDEIVNIFGYSRKELIGSTVDMLVPHHERARHPQHRAEFRNNTDLSKINKGRLPGLSQSGRIIPVQMGIRKLTDAPDTSCVVSMVDMSEQIAQADILEAAKVAAESANLAKSEFLSVMSHEIRTPLNAIIGMLYLLQTEQLNDKQAAHVEKLNKASNGLLSLINNILDFSKIEANELDLDIHPFSLGRLFDDLESLFQPTATEAGVRLNIVPLPDNFPPTLQGDSTRLKQVLTNLLSNAIKFTEPNGSVTLEVLSYQCETDDQMTIDFQVSDTGIGIPEAAQASLFEAFTQADTSTTRKYGGSGLGLSIVKRLVNLMGGDISVESLVPLGSQFRFNVCMTYSHDVILNLSKSQPSRALSILIAEDNPIDQEVLAEMSNHLGWQAEVVADGKSLIDKILKNQQLHQPVDCIIVDWVMPGLDGLQTIVTIKQKVGEKNMPAVIMVTAEDKARLLVADHATLPDSILTKPIDASLLFNSVNLAVSKHGGLDECHLLDLTTIEDNQYYWLDGLTILVIDDSEINLFVAKNILEKQGSVATTCLSANEAIELLKTTEVTFDGILMDIQMPDMSGIEATHIIHEDLGLDIPIMALSAGVSKAEIQAAREAGMVDFLSKPVQPEHMIRTLRKVISEHQQIQIPVRPKPTEASLSDVSYLITLDDNGWPNLAGIDIQIAKKLIGNDIDFYSNLLEIFARDQADTCRIVEDLIALPRPNFKEVISHIHKLKGQSANIGATKLSELCAEMMTFAESEQKDVTEVFDRLKAEHGKLLSQINQYLNGDGKNTDN